MRPGREWQDCSFIANKYLSKIPGYFLISRDLFFPLIRLTKKSKDKLNSESSVDTPQAVAPDTEVFYENTSLYPRNLVTLVSFVAYALILIVIRTNDIAILLQMCHVKSSFAPIVIRTKPRL